MLRNTRLILCVLMIALTHSHAFADTTTALPAAMDKKLLPLSHAPKFFPLPPRTQAAFTSLSPRAATGVPLKHPTAAIAESSHISASSSPASAMTQQQAQQIISIFTASGLE